MSVFEYLQVELARRCHQMEYVASPQSLIAMNSLVQKALQLTSLNKNREGRLLFLATALQHDSLESASLLTQAEVSTIIELLKAPDSWKLKEGALSDIVEIERECLKQLGQLEMDLSRKV